MTDLRTGEERLRQSYRPLASPPHTRALLDTQISVACGQATRPQSCGVPASPQPSRYGPPGYACPAHAHGREGPRLPAGRAFFLETLKKGALQSLFHTQ
ncbi:unnamed protein product [Boreogadus saida]